jgi:hypothetical protein
MHYLDVHSGSLQVAASAILVLVTTVYTFLTRSMAKAARESLRPYVYLDLSFRSIAEMVIVIGNSGSKVVGNVAVAMANANSEKISELINKLPTRIGHLSPGSTRRSSLIVGPGDLIPQNAPAATFEFQITYHDGAREISDRQRFDLDGYREALVFGYDQPLVQIAAQLRDIANKMPREQRSTFAPFGKACPYCGTLIAQSAKKCHRCHEWLSGRTRRAPHSRSKQVPGGLTYRSRKKMTKDDGLYSR